MWSGLKESSQTESLNSRLSLTLSHIILYSNAQCNLKSSDHTFASFPAALFVPQPKEWCKQKTSMPEPITLHTREEIWGGAAGTCVEHLHSCNHTTGCVSRAMVSYGCESPCAQSRWDGGRHTLVSLSLCSGQSLPYSHLKPCPALGILVRNRFLAHTLCTPELSHSTGMNFVSCQGSSVDMPQAAAQDHYLIAISPVTFLWISLGRLLTTDDKAHILSAAAFSQ